LAVDRETAQDDIGTRGVDGDSVPDVTLMPA
jgi:hypothetical protein